MLFRDHLWTYAFSGNNLSTCVCCMYNFDFDSCAQGGRHTDYVTDQVVSKLIEVVKKKEKKSGIQIKPFQVWLL